MLIYRSEMVETKCVENMSHALAAKCNTLSSEGYQIVNAGFLKEIGYERFLGFVLYAENDEE